MPHCSNAFLNLTRSISTQDLSIASIQHEAGNHLPWAVDLLLATAKNESHIVLLSVMSNYLLCLSKSGLWSFGYVPTHRTNWTSGDSMLGGNSDDDPMACSVCRCIAWRDSVIWSCGWLWLTIFFACQSPAYGRSVMYPHTGQIGQAEIQHWGNASDV